MSESKYREIKLFGRTIPLLAAFNDHLSSSPSSLSSSFSSSSSLGLIPDCLLIDRKEEEQTKETSRKESTEDVKQEDKNTSDHITNDLKDSPTISSELKKTISDTSSPKSSKNGDQQSEITTSTSQENTPKITDKILPCPRCNSVDTKFCYYNNYNATQPRHFCKNCQRYWTAGGAMRNVPVGAGRRKNKSSSSNHSMQINSANNSTTILNFGSNSEVAQQGQNGFYYMPEKRILEKGNENSSRSSTSFDKRSNITGLQETTVIRNYPGFLTPQVTFPLPPPLPYQWNPTIPQPNYYPLPFYTPPPAYWGSTIPFFPPPNSTINHCASRSSPTTSPSLGKRSRDGNLLGAERECRDSERSVVSKSLRIDEPGEAAKSSIWSTREIISDKTDLISERSLFEGFESKGNERNYISETSLALQANPAAFSRSLNFRESVIARPEF